VAGWVWELSFKIIDAYFLAIPTDWQSVNHVAKFRPDGLGSHSLLGTPVANTQTLELIYQINYV